MIEVENTDVNIVRNLIPMRNHMPASAYGLKAISDWLSIHWFLLSKFTSSYIMKNFKKINGKFILGVFMGDIYKHFQDPIIQSSKYSKQKY